MCFKIETTAQYLQIATVHGKLKCIRESCFLILTPKINQFPVHLDGRLFCHFVVYCIRYKKIYGVQYAETNRC